MSDVIRQYLGQSKYSLICKQEKGLSKHEKGLSELHAHQNVQRIYHKRV